MESSQQAAGWYDDPENATQLRYWDGSQWTNDRSPKAGGQPAAGAGGYAPVAGAGSKTNSKAIWSLVLSLVSLLIWLTAIPGVILGFMARSEIAQRPNETGDGMALAGIICGLVFGIIGLILSINFIANA